MHNHLHRTHNNRNLLKSCRYAICGLKTAFKRDLAFRREVGLTICLLPLAIYLGKTATEQALLAGSWLIVPLCEIINSALETTVDRISTINHPLSKAIKDMGAAAVLWSILQAAIVWLIILLNQ